MTVQRADSYSDKINKVKHDFNSIDNNWASDRMKLYIASHIVSLQDALRDSSEKLEFERKVNDRVNEIFKGWFHREG